MRHPSPARLERKRRTEEHQRHPLHEGPLHNPSGRGFATCSYDRRKWLTVALRLRRNRVAAACFVSSHHPKLKACASLLTDAITDWTVWEVLRLHPSDLVARLYLGANGHLYACMALNALWDAIRGAMRPRTLAGCFGWRSLLRNGAVGEVRS